VWSVALVVLAGVTDAADGRVARWMKRRGGTGPDIGGWLDPAVDKLFVAAVLATIWAHTHDLAVIALVGARELVLVPLTAVYLVLVRRTPHRDGWPTADPELTVKFRNQDLDKAAAIDLRPATERSYRIKFKGAAAAARRPAASGPVLCSCILTGPGEHRHGRRARAQGVPALRNVLEQPQAAAGVVQEARMTEVWAHRRLDFGHGIEAHADLAVWRPMRSVRRRP
jgi:hypothetical protein